VGVVVFEVMSLPEASEPRALRQRWLLVAARQRAEAEAASAEQKLDEAERLMLSIDDFGWREALDDDRPVRARWARLRERLGAPVAR
jgi:hypothetical protein